MRCLELNRIILADFCQGILVETGNWSKLGNILSSGELPGDV